MTLAVMHHTAGRLPQAESIYQQILRVDPNQPDTLHLLGVIAHQTGKNDIAVDLISRALVIEPDCAEAHNNLGTAFKNLERPGEAAASYHQALAIKPDFAEAHNNLGNALIHLGELDEAVASYRKALAIKPDYAEAHFNLGTAFQDLGRPDDAVESYHKALAVKPDYAEARNNLGNAFKDLGKLDEAVMSYHAALAIRPDFAEAHDNLGNALKNLGRLDEALASYHQALTIKPDYAEAHSNLGLALDELGRQEEAVASYHRALAVKPDYPEAHCNLGNALKVLGRLDEAMASYHEALAIRPDYAVAHGNLLFTQNYVSDLMPLELLDEARRYGAIVAARATPLRGHSNSPDAERRLRVGLVSGDFRHHSVGFFLAGVLSAIDPEVIEIFAYATSNMEDDLTARIQSNVAKWRTVVGVPDGKLAGDMAEDGIDILVDLSGHTGNNRLPLFSWKPAPILVTWLGYFATTGVEAIDYILCDRWVLPPEEEKHFVEAPYRLPDSYLCFTPPDLEIDVGPLPAQTNGHVTFGCFNNLTKLNDSVMSCWSKVLRAVPDSRLLLKTWQLGDASSRQQISYAFSDRGISADRLIFETSSPRDELLRTYWRVDVCLDPFPYPGGTTSVEALWMGVPVLTLQGDRFLSHVGESILHTVGLDDWIAPTVEEYVELAKAHTSNPAALATLRGGLRQRLVASPMCDASRFARNLEDAFRGMWRIWCQQGSQPSLEE
jgi:protein O-GlcNAc transferase